MNKLGVVRALSELGLTGGAVTGGAYAAEYSREAARLKEINTKAHETMKNLGMTQYLLNTYLLTKQSAAAKEITVELQRFHTCLRDYLMVTGNEDCIHDIKWDYELNNKLKTLGIDFA